MESAEIVVIGAGPAGALAASLLQQRGHHVVVFEQSQFPRFSIGESLLPQCMEFIAEAGMLEAVQEENFQYKDGAVFVCNGRSSSFDFQKKFSAGPGTTFQVQRARFDQVLADAAARQGADIRFGHRITGISGGASEGMIVNFEGASSIPDKIRAGFVLDASGFGRVLPRMIGLEKPSDFPVRRSVFTHIQDNIKSDSYDRNKIMIVVHPEDSGVWYWLIPFRDGRCSVGVVAEAAFLDALGIEDNAELLKACVAASPDLAALLPNAEFDTAVQSISGYASNVSSLWGDGFALLGNAGEFLDPIFSSGVTIAMKSASLAAPLVSRQISGGLVDWQSEYSIPLKRGVDTFRAYVDSWYAGDFQKIVFATNQKPSVRAMVCSILAGYAWDDANPFVVAPQRRLSMLGELCEA